MAPWAGRLDNGLLPWRGRVHQMRKNLGPHSIHGLVFDTAWAIERSVPDSISLRRNLDDLWPLGGEIRHRISLTPNGMTFSLEVRAGTNGMPWAAGWHPWFERAGEDVGLKVDAEATLVTTDDLIPTGELAPIGEEGDLRSGPLVGERRLDHVYVDARSPAIVRWPDLELHLEFGPPIETLVVYTPEGAACVEPQSAWPNASSLAARGVVGTGLAALEPGERSTLEMQWSWRVFDPPSIG
jgi:galactose mutarotase-like enzyme